MIWVYLFKNIVLIKVEIIDILGFGLIKIISNDFFKFGVFLFVKEIIYCFNYLGNMCIYIFIYRMYVFMYVRIYFFGFLYCVSIE